MRHNARRVNGTYRTLCVVLAAFIVLLGAGRASAQTVPPGELARGTDLVRLHPALRRALSETASTDFLPIIIEWRQDPGVTSLAGLAPDKLARRRAIVAALQADAARRTAALVATLDAALVQGQARNVRTFWVSPVIALEAQPALIAALAQHPDVVQIRPDARIELPPSHFTEAPETDDALPWNLTMIRAGTAQAALGLDGSGITVANLDTGIDWQHPALLTRYRGYRGRLPAVR